MEWQTIVKQYEIAYADGKMYKCNERVPDTYALNIEWSANCLLSAM